MVGTLGRPNTATLIAIGMAVGQMVGMYWKREFRRPRPVQVFPPLMPIILTPAHPSYPSNHSFQSHLIAHAVNSVFDGDAADAMHPQLFAMAARIAKGREIAGVHFPSDSDAGKHLAQDVFGLLNQVDSFRNVRNAAKAEWLQLKVGPRDAAKAECPQLKVGPHPVNLGPETTLVDQIADRVIQRLNDQRRVRTARAPEKSPPRSTEFSAELAQRLNLSESERTFFETAGVQSFDDAHKLVLATFSPGATNVEWSSPERRRALSAALRLRVTDRYKKAVARWGSHGRYPTGQRVPRKRCGIRRRATNPPRHWYEQSQSIW
jgi:hypothetical protein